MENKFCYEHNVMAWRVGDDHYQREVFYCDKGRHYLLRDGESRRHVNVKPRRILPKESLDEALTE